MMAELRAFILDDEPLAVTRLRSALSKFEQVTVVGTSASSRSAVKEIEACAPDVIFLDINMPGLSGFDLLKQLQTAHAPLVVFVTAHEMHGARAFDVDAVDYLLKPFSSHRLQTALNKIAAAHGHAQIEKRSVSETRHTSTPFADDQFFWAVGHRERVRVPVRDVMWIEAERDYVRFHSSDGGAGKISRATLNDVEAKLDPNAFVRVHRSAIVRRSSIAAFRRHATGSMSATLSNGDEVPVGRSYFKGLRQLVHNQL